MNNYKYIFHPKTNKKHKINSKNGQKILKEYIKYINNQSGGFSLPDKNNFKTCGNPIDVSQYKSPCSLLPLDNFKTGGKKKNKSRKKIKNKSKKSFKKKK